MVLKKHIRLFPKRQGREGVEETAVGRNKTAPAERRVDVSGKPRPRCAGNAGSSLTLDPAYSGLQGYGPFPDSAKLHPGYLLHAIHGMFKHDQPFDNTQFYAIQAPIIAE